jgi:hypothetical protein
VLFEEVLCIKQGSSVDSDMVTEEKGKVFVLPIEEFYSSKSADPDGVALIDTGSEREDFSTDCR